MTKAFSTAALILLTVGLSSIVLAVAVVPEEASPIFDGPELDYQPSIIRVEPTGQLMVVFERISLPSFFGDLFVTLSDDDGLSWSTPLPAIASPLNERHPSLVQLDEDSFGLFYLVDETGGGTYRLFRATSPDGLTWTQDPERLDLGWDTPGEINPNVIHEADGTLTMTYHRYPYPGLSHIAQSHDGGATWDQLMTPVSDGDANLPRLAKRESDGLYMVTYQIGSSDVDLFAKVSNDPYDWSSSSQIPVSTDINTHDSQPIVLEDGAFLVTYAKTPVYYFDLFYRVTYDGVNWRDEEQVTDDYLHYDTQPHPLLHGTPGHILLTWSHQDGADPYVDHDVWIDTDLLVQPNLSAASKTVTPDLFAPGMDVLTYTLTLPNTALTTTATLIDPIPSRTHYVADSLWASGGEYGYDPASQAITWTGLISAGHRVTVTFQVSPGLSLADGQRLTNTAMITDDWGTVYTGTVTGTADAQPPTSVILEPEAGQIISTTTFLVSGVATDSVSGVEEVAVSVDGEPWQTATGQAQWSWMWDGCADGPHNLRSRARDTVGHFEVPSPGITVTLDTTLPELLAFSPISGAVDVPLDASIDLTFSEPIITDTLSFSVAPDPGGWHTAWNASGTVAELAHDAFASGQVYTATVSEARDRALHPISAVTWTFTSTEPTVHRLLYLPLLFRDDS